MNATEQPELTFHAYVRRIRDRNYYQNEEMRPEPQLQFFLAAVYKVPGGFQADAEVAFPANPITREAFLAAMDEAENRARFVMQEKLQDAAEKLMEAARALGGPSHPQPEKASRREIQLDSQRALPAPRGDIR